MIPLYKVFKRRNGIMQCHCMGTSTFVVKLKEIHGDEEQHIGAVETSGERRGGRRVGHLGCIHRALFPVSVVDT